MLVLVVAGGVGAGRTAAAEAARHEGADGARRPGRRAGAAGVAGVGAGAAPPRRVAARLRDAAVVAADRHRAGVRRALRRRVAADRAGRAARRRLHAGHRLVPADGRGAARPLVRDPGRGDRGPGHRGGRRGGDVGGGRRSCRACSASTRTRSSSAAPPAAAPTRPRTTGRRGCCSCRSTAWASTPCGARSATATCPRSPLWLAQGSHALTEWHCDWSSQTGASVCGILHGRNDDILGFRWYEKDRDHVMACAHPEDAAEIERRHADGRGLLAVDGASRGNLFTGDAPHVSLTMSAVPLLAGSGRRGRRAAARFGAGYYAYFANPYNAVRTLGAAIADIVREITASVGQRRAGRAAAHQPRRALPVRPGGHQRDRPRRRRRGDHRGHARGRACVLRRFPRLRRGRPPLRHRAVRRARRAPRDRPADRAAVPGHPARAAALPAGRAVRPRADPGRGVHPPVRGVRGGAGRTAVRRGSAEPLGQAGGPPPDRVLAGRRGVRGGGRPGGAAAARPGAAHPRRPPAHRVRRARPRHPGGARRGGRLVRARRDGVVRRAPRPGRAGDDRGGVPRPAARAGRPPRRRVRARALGRVRPGRARPRRRAPARDRRGARRGPARPLRPARRRPRPPRRHASRTARTS